MTDLRASPPAQLGNLSADRQAPPRSLQFDDIYHAADAADEVERTFMRPAGLDARFAGLGAETMTVGELGFGTGLNLAVLARSFLRTAPREARLHFISIEKHPLRHEDFAELARRRRHDLPLYETLATQQPALLAGWQRRHFHDGRVTLSLFYGDVQDGLADLQNRTQRPVDHWLLDGFAPDRNPAMWCPAVFEFLAALSTNGTTACTFSAAGTVRRGLTSAGFDVVKVDQRPHKRHSTLATFTPGGTLERRPVEGTRTVQVFGAGLAGSCVARACAERGMQVILFDPASPPPTRIPVATAHPRIMPSASLEARLRLRSYHFSSHWLGRFPACRRTGVLRLADSEADLARMHDIDELLAGSGPWLQRTDSATASSIVGLPVKVGGHLLPDALTVDMAPLLKQMCDHPRIQRVSAEPLSAEPMDANPSDAQILCLGGGSSQASFARYLEVLPVWGQLELLKLRLGPSLPLVGFGVVTPGLDPPGMVGVGASYEHSPWPPARASAFNLDRLEAWWARCIKAPLNYDSLGSVRGVRAVTSDRLPIIGALNDPDGQTQSHRFISAGHGSHGTLTAPLAADCLAATLDGDFPILDSAETALVAADRFLARQARRGLRHGARSV